MTKQDLFEYLQTTLQELTDTPFKSVERWKNQVKDKARTGLPGAFIQLEFTQITQIAGGGGVKKLPSGVHTQSIIQNLGFVVNIHVYDKTFEDNETYKNIYDLEQIVYLALQGKQKSDEMTPLIRGGGSEEDELSTLDNCIVTFVTTLTDDSAASGKTIISTTLPPEVTRGTI